MSFPNVFKAKSAFEGNEPVFSVQMLFPKETDISELKKLVQETALKKWGSKDKFPKKMRSPFKDGDDTEYDSTKSMIVVEARSKMQPGLVDAKVQPIIDPSAFYAGCWARATLTCYAYDKAGNSGVSFGLQNIQKLKDDASFGGKTSATSDFGTIDTESEVENDYGF